MKWISCEKDGCFDVCLVKGGAAGRVHTGGIVEGSALGSPTTKDHVVLCMSLHSYVQNTYSLMMENHWTTVSGLGMNKALFNLICVEAAKVLERLDVICTSWWPDFSHANGCLGTGISS